MLQPDEDRTAIDRNKDKFMVQSLVVTDDNCTDGNAAIRDARRISNEVMDSKLKCVFVESQEEEVGSADGSTVGKLGTACLDSTALSSREREFMEENDKLKLENKQLQIENDQLTRERDELLQKVNKLENQN
jgi:hypothetical protein